MRTLYDQDNLGTEALIALDRDTPAYPKCMLFGRDMIDFADPVPVLNIRDRMALARTQRPTPFWKFEVIMDEWINDRRGHA